MSLEGWAPEPDAKCQKCGTAPVGPGGILCPGCKTALETTNAELIAKRGAEG